MVTTKWCNQTGILSILCQMTEEERNQFFLSKGMTEEEVIRYVSQNTVTLTEEDILITDIKHVENVLLTYVPPVLFVLGIIGNVLSFIILRHRLMTKQSTYLYLAVLTVADSLVLLVGPLRLWIGQLTKFDIRHHSNELCKVVVFLGYTTSDISVWLIIAVTIERYIVVCHPLHASTMCNIPRAKRVILFLIVCLSLINLHFFWTVELSTYNRKPSERNDNNSFDCGGGTDYTYLVEDLWPWVDAILYSFLPFFLITILNCVIIHRVTQAYRSRCRMQKRDTIQSDLRPGSRLSGGAETNAKMTAMLLAVSFTFLLTTLPMNVCLIVSALWRHRGNLTSVARFNLAFTITKLLMYTNHSMNFFLYCATGQKFRHQLLKLVCTKSFRQLSFSAGAPRSLKPLSSSLRNRRSLVANDDNKIEQVRITYV